ncbi:hypothetical protein E2C01_019068 [Portunus trituberculatus]|uniref:Uncharacterized protein n=1 Tax=Portunus trituberculatus TaxID=210409 RepID=A0A5B7DYT6_PORTR|nr:hypothetical protein [Portunus trituberculatus]
MAKQQAKSRWKQEKKVKDGNKDSGVMSDLFTSISSGHAGCDPCQRVVGLGGDGARRSETTHVPKARPGSVSVL